MESLETLLSRPEGKTLEFKRDVSSPEGMLRALVAFANGAGGTLVGGVEDGSKSVVGVANPTKEEDTPHARHGRKVLRHQPLARSSSSAKKSRAAP